jgi:hypothetical protein
LQKNKLRKERLNRKIEKEKKPTYLGHPGPTYLPAAQPTTSPVVFPRQACTQVRGAHADDGEHHPACLEASRPF